MEKIYLLAPEYMAYFPKIEALQLLLNHLGRQVEIKSCSYLIKEEANINDKPISIQKLFIEVEDYFLNQLSLEDRLQQQQIVRYCTQQLNNVVYYNLFVNDKYAVKYNRPYWSFISPIQMIKFYRLRSQLDKQLLQNVEMVLQRIDSFLEKENANIFTQVIIYCYIQSIIINTPQSQIEILYKRGYFTIHDFLDKFHKQKLNQLLYGDGKQALIKFNDEVNKEQEENKEILNQFRNKFGVSIILLTALVMATRLQ